MPYLNLPGVKLWFTDSGGDGTPLVLMHAASGISESWENQIPAFAEAGYRCIAYDRLGWGRTELDPASGPPQCASDDLHGLIDHLALDRFHLVSVANGSTPAIDYALSHPERLRSLVISDCAVVVMDEEYRKTLERIRPPEFQALPRYLRELSPRYRALHEDGVKHWLEIERAARQSDIAIQDQRNQITLELIETLRVPTLAIAGDADITTPPVIMRMVTKHITGCEWISLPEVGHCSFWEQPDAWNAHVLEFVGRH